MRMFFVACVLLVWVASGFFSLLFAMQNHFVAMRDKKIREVSGENGVILYEIRWRIRNSRKAVVIGFCTLTAGVLELIDTYVIPGPPEIFPVVLLFITVCPLFFAWKQIDDRNSHAQLLEMLKSPEGHPKRRRMD